MKNNFFISIAVLTSVFLFSCQKEVKTEENTEAVETVVDSTLVVEETPEPEVIEEKTEEKEKPKAKPKKKVTQPTGPGIPTFSGAEAKKYVRDYERYVRNYKKAVEAKDMESFLKLNKSSSALSKQYTSLISKLPPEEIQKLSSYMKVKTAQLDKLAKQMN